MASTFDIARNDLSRAFMFTQGMNICCPVPHYFPCLGVDSLTQDFGDITRIECPDPYNYGKFIEVAQVPGEIGRLTTTLTTRLSRTEISMFRSLAVQGCPFDLHLHFGLCSRPNDFNTFDKMMIFEDVFVTSYGTDPLVALNSADRDAIEETIDISVGNFYEVVPLEYSRRNPTITAGALIDSTWADVQSCGAYCDLPSTGCEWAAAIDALGNVVWTEDTGLDWTQHPQVLGANVGIIYLNGFFLVPRTDGLTPTFMLTTKEDIQNDVAWTERANVSTTLNTFTDVDAGQGQAIIVGTGGYIAVIRTPQGGIAKEFDGNITTEDLNKVQFTPGTDCALIVGANGEVIYYDGAKFQNVDVTGTPIEGLNLTAGLAISESKWIVGDDAGNLYCTESCELGWEQIYTHNTADAVHDIQMISTHIGYASIGTQLLKSFDGFCSWIEVPECSKKRYELQGTAEILDLLPCSYSPNDALFFGDDGATGHFILDGTPASSIANESLSNL